MTIGTLATPIGEAFIVFDEELRLRAFDWTEHEGRLPSLLRRQYGESLTLLVGDVPVHIRERITAYFAGDLRALDGLECATAGTPFQRQVWSALREIPAGTTATYGAIAARIGRPRAVRAVGAANGANPIGIVVPCHRVIGSDGSLTGYGGGLDRKRWLLAHEHRLAQTIASVPRDSAGAGKKV
jgi:methylated-DNA-[protein]-cysteine S-methyltransferase